MRDHPGLSAASLAKVVGAGLSTTKERLRRMGAQELIEKDPAGRWKLKKEEPHPSTQGEAPGPQQPSPN
jgi:DNA-binding IclR family transcriptional regulator